MDRAKKDNEDLAPLEILPEDQVIEIGTEDTIAAEEINEVFEQDSGIMDSFKKGLELFAAKKYAEAEEAFTHATEDDPKNVQAWYNKGVALGMLGKAEDAEVCYTRARHLTS